MKNALRKEFQREIHGSLQRFISILLMSALGVAMFAGLRACKTNMLLTADSFYDDSNMMDVRIVSPLGLSDADVDAIKGADGVRTVCGAFSADVLLRHGDADVAVRLYSMTDQVNEYLVMEGRLPKDAAECAVDQSFMESRGFHIGDTLTFHSGTENEISDTLAENTVTIVGAVRTGRYMSSARGSGTIGNGKIAGYVVLVPECFTVDYYAEIYVVFDGTKELNSYEDAYDDLVGDKRGALEAVGRERAKLRLGEVQADAYKELEEAFEKVQENERALFDGEQEILDVEQAVADGFAQVEEGRAQLAKEWEELPGRFAEYDTQLAGAKQELEKAWEKLAKEEAPVTAAREEYEAYVEQLKAISQGPDDIKRILAVMGISEEEIIKAEEQVAQARALLEEKEQEVAGQEAELAVRKQEAEDALVLAAEELDGTEQSLKQKQQDIADAKEEYYASLAKNKEAIAKAYREIEDSRGEIADMEIPEWYILDRNTIESYVGFGQDADRMDAISMVFPAIFFLVAALVSLTTMTRMVDEGRTQIGTLKALGYTRRAVAGKYIKYALYATLIGSVIGVFSGGKIFPYIVITTYKLMYPCLPGVVMPIHAYYSVMAVVLAVVCTLAATLSACMRAFKEQPASLMRPTAPKAGKRIFLERVGLIWKHLSFTWKASLRNMFRYKKRFFMTVIGIGSCMALLLVGFGLKDSIGVMAQIQYGQLWRYDSSVSIRDKAAQEEKNTLWQWFSENPDIADISFARESTLDITANGITKSISIVVLPDAAAFGKFFCFRDRASKTEYSIRDGGVIITEKLARMLKVQAGDTVQLEPDASVFYPVKVEAVAENYIYHYVFMTESTYEQIFGEKPIYNECFLRFTADAAADEERVAADILRENEIVTSVMVTSTLQKQIDDMLQSLNIITYVLIICAGLLAFVVLYNLSNINITERRRELATLKVLGFYDAEVSGYVYRENVLLTLIGILLGMAGGKLLHGYVITTCEVDMVMFGHIIKPVSFLYSGLLTVLFAVIIGMMMHFKLKKIDMIESLKSIE